MMNVLYNGIIVFICTEAWAPICIFLYVSGQNESVQLKPIGSLYNIAYPVTLHEVPLTQVYMALHLCMNLEVNLASVF